jgi:CRP-like cAMP-binding protein
MPLGKVLYESGDVLRHVYFPIDCIVSLLYVMEDGASAEISVVGNDGIVGIALFMGGETTPSRAIVQSAGHAYRLIGQRLKDECHSSSEMQHLLLRYTQGLITQIAQTAVCNRHHSVDQQLCRWLLLALDRLSDNHLTMTQELIANMLGVRREGVTAVAGLTALSRGCLLRISQTSNGPERPGETGSPLSGRSAHDQGGRRTACNEEISPSPTQEARQLGRAPHANQCRARRAARSPHRNHALRGARANVRHRYFFAAALFFVAVLAAALFFVAFFFVAFFFVAFFFVTFSFCFTSPNFACAFPRVF